MQNLSDIDIAKKAQLKPITQIADKLGLPIDLLELYGAYKAKINQLPAKNAAGKLVLVTAISPTPAGEGKTTVTIGLADALSSLGKRAVIAMREPSLGPVFGIKGGAAGGGYAQVVPMEDINLHFTGDMHAIGAANNLLAALLDNHIYHGNSLNIDVRRVTWRRALDMNDRQLRAITDGLGGRINGVPREDGFDITVASEVMAVFCLATDLENLKQRLGEIVVAYNFNGEPIFARDLKADGAMCALLKDAFKPNLVQTLEGTPALVHGGPFANIAHGCNSVVATRTAMSLADFTITEAGFGADLGAQKFLDIKCRAAKLKPSAVVVVATIRALKYQGGARLSDLTCEDLVALKNGMPNLLRHIENITQVYRLPCVVALNHFITDSEAEINTVQDECAKFGVNVALTKVWGEGGKGGVLLAEQVLQLCEQENNMQFCYAEELGIDLKIEQIAKRIYRADGVELSKTAQQQLQQFKKLGFDQLPVCIAKTQYSFSDDPKLLGAPTGFKLNVRQFKLSKGAGFVVALTGEVMTMPGLPKIPAAEQIDVDANGTICGLF